MLLVDRGVAINKEKLASYYLLLPVDDSQTRLLKFKGIETLIEAFWHNAFTNNPTIFRTGHRGVQEFPENRKNREKLFNAYLSLLKDFKNFTSDKYKIKSFPDHLGKLSDTRTRIDIDTNEIPKFLYMRHLLKVILYNRHLLSSWDLGALSDKGQVDIYLDNLIEDAKDYLDVIQKALYTVRSPGIIDEYSFEAWYSISDSHEFGRIPYIIYEPGRQGFYQAPSFVDSRGNFKITINRETVSAAQTALSKKVDHPLLFALGVLFKRKDQYPNF